MGSGIRETLLGLFSSFFFSVLSDIVMGVRMCNIFSCLATVGR